MEDQSLLDLCRIRDKNLIGILKVLNNWICLMMPIIYVIASLSTGYFVFPLFDNIDQLLVDAWFLCGMILYILFFLSFLSIVLEKLFNRGE